MDKEKEKKIKLNKERNSLIVQSNQLIRDARPLLQDLSVSEAKLLIYIISKICAEDKEFKTIKFNISNYCDICGIKKSGREYQRIRQSIKGIRDKSYWIKDGDEEVLFTYETVEIIISEALRPHLLELSKSFTKMEMINLLCLNSKYSIRLYQILKSYLWLKKYEVDIQKFREIMYIENKYPQYKEMYRNVIAPSLKQITKYTDLEVKFSTIKDGRSISKLKFELSEKNNYQMSMELLLNQEERLSIKGK